ncbi:MAG: GxxExxY protein [bacterium]
METTDNRDQLSQAAIGAAIEVHRILGPGLMESTYESCLAYELSLRNVPFAQQLSLPVNYKDHVVSSALKMDFVVDNALILELKAVEAINDIHKAQLLTYLKLSGLRTGLIINFNVKLLKHGILRMVN